MIRTKGTPMMGLIRISFVTILATTLSGCISLSSEPPASLLMLTPTTAVPAGTSASGTAATAIKIIEPEAPQRLAVTRVPVQVNDTEIAYLKEAVLSRAAICHSLRISAAEQRVCFDRSGGIDPHADKAFSH